MPVARGDHNARHPYAEGLSDGTVNSVAIPKGLAAFAVESSIKTSPGVVLFYDTKTWLPSEGANRVWVGALPDMLTCTHDGSELLVANERTPSTYGTRVGTTVPRVFNSPAVDPAGSVTIIDMATRMVVATPGFSAVPIVGSHVRMNTGMDFEPEYIAVRKDGTQAYVRRTRLPK